MSPNEIEVGKTYHNGKTGNRSYSARKVLERNATVWWDERPHFKYEQLAGPYKGQTSYLAHESFAKWAKGEVEDTNA